jgi:HK97 family phage prohead protease
MLRITELEKVEARPMDPGAYDTQDDFMKACVPHMMDKGDEQDQAVAACMNIWEGRAMSNAMRAAGSVHAIRGDRVVSFRSSTPDLDRHGTRILPEGIHTDNYDRNPIFLWGHDGYGSMMGGGPSIESIIGRTLRHEANRNGFDHEVEFAPADVNPKAEMALRMVKTGFLNSTSIGFEPKRWHEDHPLVRGGPPIIVFDEVDLLEVSLVPIPSNPNAQALARALAEMPGRKLDTILSDLGDDDLARRVERWVRSAVTGEPSRSPQLAHPKPGEPSRSQDETPKDEPPRSPVADLIANLSLRAWQPTVGHQLLVGALETLRR